MRMYPNKMIYVTHDMHFNGAQLLSLHIIQVLKHHFGYHVEIISKSGGVLNEEFGKLGNVFVVRDAKFPLDHHIRRLVDEGFQTAICNTVITGDVAEALAKHNVNVISLIHELPGVIRQYSAVPLAEAIARCADKVVFPSDYVAEKFSDIARVEADKIVIRPQGLYKKNPYRDRLGEARMDLRRKLNLPDDAKIVLGVGYADHRKGIDLFAEVAATVRKRDGNTFFLWVGNLEPKALQQIDETKKKEIIFIKATPDVGLYYAGADIYLLTSREDPFPSVVLEAMDAQVPVIGFRDAGGFSDIVTEETGSLVEYLNTDRMAQEVIRLLNQEEIRKRKGMQGRRLIEKHFCFVDYVHSLLQLLGHEYKKISVVIPNYNYARYLRERIGSVLRQTYPVYELIFLDDHSTDNSLEIFAEWVPEMESRHIKVACVVNEQNSGSVFGQWIKGISLASGDYIWIAEADDWCADQFLETVMKPFHLDRQVVLSYTQSKQMDQEGKILDENYLKYTNDIDREKWKSSYIADGRKEITEALVVKNTIPNVSGTVFKKFDIADVAKEIMQFKIAGDYYFYVWLLQKGKIAYHHVSLNMHRRHTNSVTIRENNLLHYQEVVRMQDSIINQYEVSPEMKDKVARYREFLKNYLGVADAIG